MNGIYMIINTLNGDNYKGSSCDIHRRFKFHKSLLDRNLHHSPHLQNAWNKYGKNAFKFEVLEECSREHLIEKEQWYLDNSSCVYNVAIDATSPNRGRPMSEEHKKKIGNGNRGKIRSAETKFKNSQSKVGIKFTQQHKDKISSSMKGPKCYWYGKHLPEEMRLRISETKKGRPSNRRGVILSDETKLKMSLAHKESQKRKLLRMGVQQNASY